MASKRWLRIAVVAAGLAAVTGTVAGLRDHATSADPRRNPNSISLADVAGSNVVALTVAPPKPGRVRLRVDIVGIDAADTNGITIDATSTRAAHTSARLHTCGVGCFDGTTTVPGRADTWTFGVQGHTSRAPFAIRVTAPLPAPDAGATLTDVLARMNRLRSLRVRETLQSRAHGPLLVTEFRFQAPDRFAYDQTGAGHASTIAIGTRRFDRYVSNGRWQLTTWPDPAGFVWPGNFYNAFWTPVTAVRALGPAMLRGVPTHVIAFVRSDNDAWFRLWIGDRDGLVHRMEMRARSHIMNQDYTDFDAPVAITAPKP